MAKKYVSKIAAAVHESMADLHGAGLIGKATMRSFDRSCLTRIETLSARNLSANGSAAKKTQRPVAEAVVDREGEGPRRNRLTSPIRQ
jgi:putative transcriptional regulator